jgi:hypothetical protein
MNADHVMCITAVVALRAWSQAALLQVVGVGIIDFPSAACQLADVARAKFEAAFDAGELAYDQLDFAIASVDTLVHSGTTWTFCLELKLSSWVASSLTCSSCLTLTATNPHTQVDQFDAGDEGPAGPCQYQGRT